jgi:hypothetical protein
MSAMYELRDKYKDTFEKTWGVKLGFMSIFVKAAAATLQELPVINAVIDGGDVSVPASAEGEVGGLYALLPLCDSQPAVPTPLACATYRAVPAACYARHNAFIGLQSVPFRSQHP